jgi:hypothetical protein
MQINIFLTQQVARVICGVFLKTVLGIDHEASLKADFSIKFLICKAGVNLWHDFLAEYMFTVLFR